MTSFYGVAGGMCVLASIVIALVAGGSLPKDAKIPIHFGLGGFDNFVGRTFGLVLWPSVSIVVYVIGLLAWREGGGIFLALLIALPLFAYMAFRNAEIGADRGTGKR